MSAKLESRTLEMVLDLLDIPRDAFKGRTLTTGATASNILGLGTYSIWIWFTHLISSLGSVCTR